MSQAFLEAVRAADWASARSLLAGAEDLHAVLCPAPSIPAWLIGLNAPPDLVVECLLRVANSEQIKTDAFALLECCLPWSNEHSNAFATFVALLAAGVSPNRIVSGGETLLQLAIRLGRAREVAAMLRYGIDPNQMSVFGPESTSNREDAGASDNEAGKLAHAWFSSQH